MYNANELLEKLKELENQIRKNIKPDGSLAFDPYKVMVSLELALRMISEKNDITVDGETLT